MLTVGLQYPSGFQAFARLQSNNCLVALGNFTALEKHLVVAAGLRIHREQNDSGRGPVQPVHRHQVINAGLVAQANQRRLLEEAPTWSGWQEMRLVPDHEVRILMREVGFQGDRWCYRTGPVLPNELVL